MYEAKTVDATGQHVIVIDIPLTPDLAPTAHMMAYYVRPDLEIVADGIAFNVDGVFENEVKNKFENWPRFVSHSMVYLSFALAGHLPLMSTLFRDDQ